VYCRVLSCRVLSCRVLSCRVLSCRVLSCRVLSCTVVYCRVLSCVFLQCLQSGRDDLMALGGEDAHEESEEVALEKRRQWASDTVTRLTQLGLVVSSPSAAAGAGSGDSSGRRVVAVGDAEDSLRSLVCTMPWSEDADADGDDADDDDVDAE
jgi:hypothetical protein